MANLIVVLVSWRSVLTDLDPRYSSDGVRLTAVNRAQLVQRLGAGVHHVTTLLDRHLGWDRSADDDKFGPLTMERFIKEVAPNLTGDAGLSVRDFIPDSASRQFQSPPVVLDPRCHVLSVEDSRGGSVPVGDDEGDVFRTATRKNSTMAVFNEGCVVHESLRCEVGSDWRGALSASRDSPQIRIARTVIARARIMATQLVAEKMDVLDNDWMEDEKADHQPLALQSLFDVSSSANHLNVSSSTQHRSPGSRHRPMTWARFLATLHCCPKMFSDLLLPNPEFCECTHPRVCLGTFTGSSETFYYFWATLAFRITFVATLRQCRTYLTVTLLTAVGTRPLLSRCSLHSR